MDEFIKYKTRYIITLLEKQSLEKQSLEQEGENDENKFSWEKFVPGA